MMRQSAMKLCAEENVPTCLVSFSQRAVMSAMAAVSSYQWLSVHCRHPTQRTTVQIHRKFIDEI